MSLDQFLLSADTTDLNYPEIRPTLDLNFARVKALDPRITFTRSSGGSYVGADGLIKYAGVNEARFDHNPVTGESLGLLIEESRTNLLLRSEEFDNAGWTKSGTTVSADQTASPIGAVTADKIIENTGVNSQHWVGRLALGLPSAIYTCSIYAKAAERTRLSIFIDTSVTRRTQYFNLSTGALGSNSGGITSSMQFVGNGWYRCSITLNAAEGFINAVYTPAIGNNNIYTGDGTSGIYIWGAQVEEGAFPTSYIPTIGSTRTRAADNASITGKNFSSWYNPSEWTLVTRTSVPSSNLIASPAGVQYSSIDDGTSNNLYSIRYVTDTSSPYIDGDYANASGVPTFDFTGSSYNTFPNPVKSALAVKLNDAAFCYNGNTVETDSSVTLSTSVNRLVIGGAPKAGTISRLTYYPKRLPNAQLQALTR